MAMPCVFAIQNKARSPFHQTRQWCPQCWQTATLLVTISSRRGGGRFPSASCDQITGRNSSLNGHIHQPISSHHAKLWRVARRSRTSSTRTSRLRQRGHFMQSTPFLLWICTHYTACTPPLQSLSGISYCARFSYSSFGAIYVAIVVLIFSGARPGIA